MNSFLESILLLSRSNKRIITLLLDSILLFFAFSMAYIARLENLQFVYQKEFWATFAMVLPLTLICFLKLGLYKAVIRYLNLHVLWSIVAGCFLSVLAFFLTSNALNAELPRAIPFIYFVFSLFFIGSSRIVVRSLVGVQNWYNKEAVIIYGAGSAGRQLATALSQGPEYYVAAFVDDDVHKQEQVIQGVTVYSPKQIGMLTNTKSVKSVLLALPSATRARRKEVLSSIERLPVKVLTIPGMADLVKGRATLDEFKDVEIEDLLGRDPVAPKQELMAANIRGKVVMVTGAGGSIGSELCRQIIKQEPLKLILFELSEFSLYAIEKELKEKNKYGVEIIPLMGSIQKSHKLESVMRTFRIQTIYHAAAYKHVPLVEHNVIEGVRNNIFGTLNTAKAAIQANVETFVLISTDKAVRPTNVMGTTKRMAELVLQALAKTQKQTRFSMVRFGNVLGSSGSVVPLFRKQIRQGGPLTLTHMDITRYFMTIPEASQLVIQAGAMGKGGDVFVLDMGESVKIYDLAAKMIHLSGLEIKDKQNPNGDIEIKCTGLRPGEKLYEELLIGDNVYGTNHERIMTAKEDMLEWEQLDQVLIALNDACDEMNHDKIRKILIGAPTGFNPKDGICDLLWLEKNKTQPQGNNKKVQALKRVL